MTKQLDDISYGARLVGFILLFVGWIIPGIVAWAIADITTVLKYRDIDSKFWKRWNYTGMGLSALGAIAVILEFVFPPLGIIGLMAFSLGVFLTHIGVTLGVPGTRLNNTQKLIHISAAVLMAGFFLFLAPLFPAIGFVFPAVVALVGAIMIWAGLCGYFGGAAFNAPTTAGKFGWSTLGFACLGVSLLFFPPAAFAAFGLAALCGLGCLVSYFTSPSGGLQVREGVLVGAPLNDQDFGPDASRTFGPQHVNVQTLSQVPGASSQQGFKAFTGQGHKLGGGTAVSDMPKQGERQTPSSSTSTTLH